MRRLPLGALAAIVIITWGCPQPAPEEFVEEHPAYSMHDLKVFALVAEPDRADLGETVTLRAWVTNGHRSASEAAQLVFSVDDVELARDTVAPLALGEELTVTASWAAALAGRHVVKAELELADDAVIDRNPGNNARTILVRVDGETDPTPEIEFELEVVGDAAPAAGDSATLSITAHNPSFADVSDVPLAFYIDGALIGEDTIEGLEPGQEQSFRVPWAAVTGGEHTVVAVAEVGEEYGLPVGELVESWSVPVPEPTTLYSLFQTDWWVSIGPRLLPKSSPNNSVGRMNSLAFDPVDSSVLYAGGAGGIWKTTTSGDDWTPVGDKLPRTDAMGLAVDPGNRQIVYATTGSWGARNTDPDAPIYKSTDGGTTWHVFLSGLLQGAGTIVVRRPTTGSVVVYVGSNRGLYRYTSTTPGAATSTTAEWTPIHSGPIRDLAVHPTNHEIVYASVHDDAVYRTKSGTTATTTTGWTKLNNGIPANAQMSVDIMRGTPTTVYGCNRVAGAVKVYVSTNEGDTWEYLFQKNDSNAANDVQYNPFIRVHPSKHTVYYGGGRLYKSEQSGGTWSETEITGVHVDHKELLFDPSDSSRYYSLNDGGIWRCTVVDGKKDTPTHRNYDLRTTQFFDIDCSRSSSKIIGGTQDTGTILYDGSPDWNEIRGGDGNYSVIASANDKVMYAQLQFLRDTARTEDGGKSWPKASNGLPAGDNWRSWIGGGNSAQIVAHPNDATGYTLLAQGPEVYHTGNGGLNWGAKGPKGAAVSGNVNRVAVQPVTFTWFAGMSQGQIWYSSTGGAGTWSLASSHPINAGVQSMAFAPSNHKILYVAYNSWDAYYRVERLEMLAGGSWAGTWISDNLPKKHVPLGLPFTVYVVTGDASDDDRCYVGTNKGVYRWKNGEPTYASWTPYNDGLPLVDVLDLMVDPSSNRLVAATWGRGAWMAITGP